MPFDRECSLRSTPGRCFRGLLAMEAALPLSRLPAFLGFRAFPMPFRDEDVRRSRAYGFASAQGELARRVSLGGRAPDRSSRYGSPRRIGHTRHPTSPRAPSVAYRAITFCGRAFQNVRLDGAFVTPWAGRRRSRRIPLHHARNATGLTRAWFRLFPPRSPLLGESMSLSLPEGTEMFQFPPFADVAYAFSGVCRGMTPCRFPDSEIPGSLPA